MKYLKLIFLLFLLIQISFLSADDLIKPENEVITPDNESLQIDLDSIKKDIRDKGKTPVINTKKVESKQLKSKKVKKNKSVPKTDNKKKIAHKKEEKSGKKTGNEKVQVSKKQKQINKPDAKSEVNKAVEVETVKKAVSDNKKTTAVILQKDQVTGIEDKSVVKAADKTTDNSQGLQKTDVSSGPDDTIIINPLSAETGRNRLYFIDYTGLGKWGKPKGLKIQEDLPPVVDGISFFTPDYSAEFNIAGYDREKNYRLLIDFVRYEGKPGPLNSLLKIWGRDIKGKMILIAEINEKILEQNKIFETLVPYELSSPGRFDIIVREYSDTPGKWGIWDMIITAKRTDQLEIIRPDASEKMKEIEPKIFK